jgi:multicomponent Na+:H+ antiporter subunit A
MSLWHDLLIVAGAATMLTGALLALRETDLKRVLAWSTVASLGTLVMLIGLPDPIGAKAMVAFLLGHALYKAALFLVAGIIDHETGTRDATGLGGLAGKMPLTAAAAALAALSMGGILPLFGFISKELMYEATLTLPGLLTLVAVACSAAMFVVAALVGARPFLGRLRETPLAPHDPPMAMLAGPLLLAGLGVLFGLAPGLAAAIVEPAVSAVRGQETHVSLYLWHGVNTALMLSIVTTVIGIALFLSWGPVQSGLARVSVLDSAGPDAIYGRAMAGLERLAASYAASVHGGTLRRYLWISLAVTFGGAGLVLLLGGGIVFPAEVTRPGLEHVALLLLSGFSALAAVRIGPVIGQVMALGILGFAIALLFLALGATDLAFTQFTVDIIALLLLLAILARLPFRRAEHRLPAEKRRDAVLATVVGAVGGLTMLAISAMPFDRALPDWMGENSLPLAKGRNVVNVIIVDFRAFDTLGEITVLGIAALAAWVLFRRIKDTRA